MKYSYSLFLALTFFPSNDSLNFRQIPPCNFSNSQPFEIIQVSSDSTNSASLDFDCQDWALNKVQIKDILVHSKFIEALDWDVQFDHLPCGLNGILEQNGEKYRFYANAGSWLNVYSADTVIRFSYYLPDTNNYFLSTPWTEK